MTGTPLYVKASVNALPTHQYMDIETARWLCENQSTIYADASGTKLATELLESIADIDLQRLCPDEHDFLDGRLFRGIHGLRHALRVSVFSGTIHNQSGVSLDSLRIAAKFHDVRRLNDQNDPGHGARAADYVRALCEAGSLAIRSADLRAVDAMIRYHEVDHACIPNAAMLDFGLMINAFKAADALDRARLPRLSWWPRPSKIAFQPAHSLVGEATAITVRHELLCMEGLDPHSALRLALTQIAASI